MGRVSKGARCCVEGCNEKATHSVSFVEAQVLSTQGLRVVSIDGRRAYLCEKHYKLYKKLKKKQERLERWRMRAGI